MPSVPQQTFARYGSIVIKIPHILKPHRKDSQFLSKLRKLLWSLQQTLLNKSPLPDLQPSSNHHTTQVRIVIQNWRSGVLRARTRRRLVVTAFGRPVRHRRFVFLALVRLAAFFGLLGFLLPLLILLSVERYVRAREYVPAT